MIRSAIRMARTDRASPSSTAGTQLAIRLEKLSAIQVGVRGVKDIGPIRGRARNSLEVLARVGYVAKGFVYILVGLLAAMAAASLGSGGVEGSRGALSSLRDEPLGAVLLGAIALGLIGYVVWRLVQAIKDPDGHGTDLRGLVQRAGMILSALTHGGLAVWAAGLALGHRLGDDDDQGTRAWSGRLLEQPFGAWLLGAVAIGIIIFGVAQCVIAYRASYQQRLQAMNRRTRRWVDVVARVGFVTRGIVAWIAGAFILSAALTSDPSEARGLEGALQALERQAYGPVLLGVVAAGLAAHGVFEIVKAKYRRLGPIS